MTYLAVQISLYLVSAALIGFALGWLFWGRSQHRRIAKLHEEMTTAIETERQFSKEVRGKLKSADERLNRALEAEKENAAKAVAEVRELLDAEMMAAQAARAEIDRLRLDMETAINMEKASASDTIRETMEHAESFKAAVQEGRVRETQIRAELEELRLMAGAEKLAAQTARSEFEQREKTFQSSLEAERRNSAQAREALNDIRATLARTFGEGAGIITALETRSEPSASTRSETPISAAMDLAGRAEKDTRENDDNDATSTGLETEETIEPPVFNKPIEVPGINVEPGIAFDVQDEAVTAIDNPASPDELPIDSLPDQAVPAPSDLDDDESPGSDIDPTNQPLQLRPSVVPDEQLPEPEPASERPSFYDERPDEVDDLQAIGGIDPNIEKLLNEHGCYQFKQIAHLSMEDIDRLARTIESMPDLKDRIERDGWVEQARELQAKKYLTNNDDRPRWWSRRRLQ